MKKLNKILSAALTLALAISLVACSSDTQDSVDYSGGKDVSNIMSDEVTNDVSDIMSGDTESTESDVISDLSELTGGPSSSSSSESKGGKINTSNIASEILEMRVIDCGQADSILLQAGDSVILVDAGEDRRATDIMDVLDNEGIKQIDLLVATHPHADHIGGMQTIIENYDVVEALISPATHTSKTYENMLVALDNEGCDVYSAAVGVKYEYDGLELTVIGPCKDYGDLNNNSVVLIAKYGDVDVLLTGDAEMKAEKDYVEYIYDMDILKMGHHGSSTSSSDNLLDIMKPELALISCGTDNDYGHPHKETIEKLNKRNIPMYRTDLSGDLIIRTDGESYTFDTEYDGEVSVGLNSSDKDTTQITSNNTNGDAGTNQLTGTDNVAGTSEANGNTGNKQGQITQNIVFVSKTGKKYHKSSTCSRLYTSTVINEYTMDQAIAKGLEKCSNCWED